jgi:predicted RNA-binding Zn-ribbon protein involved in translation (DUF1610 family)
MLIQNQIKCLSCGDEIWSAHRHDYKTCSCGNVSVDGGTDYRKRSFKLSGQYKEQSIELPEETVNAAIAAVKWGLETGRNERGIAYAVIRALNETGNLNQGKD